MNEWRLRLLGAFRLEHDGRSVTEFAYRRQDVLLAYLALAPRQTHSRPAVAALLWPGKSRQHALNRLTEVLTLLNRQLTEAGVTVEVVTSARQTLRLGTAVRTDVEDLEDALALAMREPDPGRRGGLLEDVVSLHGAGLLGNLDEPWVVQERARLRAARDLAVRLIADETGGSASGAPRVPLPGTPAVEIGYYRARGRQLVATATADPGGDALGAIPLLDPAVIPGETDVLAMGREAAEQALQLVERAEARLRGPERPALLAELDERRDEVHAAIDWAIEHRETELALRLVGAMWPYWYSRSLIDAGRLRLDQALVLAVRPEGRWYGKAANAAGALALQDGDLAVARRRFLDALAIWRKLEDAAGIARALNNLGIIAFKQRDLAQADHCYAECAAILRTTGDDALLATVLRNAAVAALAANRPADAEPVLRERLDLGRRLGDRDVLASTLISLAQVVRQNSGWPAARELVHEAQGHYEALGDLKGVATCLRYTGYGEQFADNLAVARAYYRASLAVCRASRDVRGMGESIRYLASISEAEGDTAQALAEYRQALQVLDDVADWAGADKAQSAVTDLEAEDSPRSNQ